MKKKQLERLLRSFGWWKYGEGANHEKWTNGVLKTTLPGHNEINELTAKSLKRLAQNNRGKK